MTDQVKFPKTLQEAILYFSNEETCIQFVADLRWPDGKAVCPRCTSNDSVFMPTRSIWRCRACNKQFSVKVASIFEDSPIPLNKWLAAMWMIAGAKNGVSSLEIHRALGITQKSAWFMMHRLRLAITQGSFEKLGGHGETVEVDETYIGGLARNMHYDKRIRKFNEGSKTGGYGKTAVFGLLERSAEKKKSKVRTKVISKFHKDAMHGEIRDAVNPGTTVYSDEFGGYKDLGKDGTFQHDFVAHAKAYVKGAVHTNGIENFWSLLKRTIRGTYVSVEPFHMFRYLDEQAFRFNEREGDDADRFLSAMSGIAGRRVTYKQLTGKDGVCPPSVSAVASADAQGTASE
jgi:transposase-like protein